MVMLDLSCKRGREEVFVTTMAWDSDQWTR